MRSTKKRTVRQTIIDTASRLFYRQGYGSTGINQIIDESGVVKSTLYTAFRTKEEILLEYLIQSGAAMDEALRLAAAKGKDPKEKVLAVFDYLIDLVQEKDFFGCNFLNMISEMPTDAAQVVKQIQKQKNGVRKLFAGILKPIGKEDLADEIYILFEGAFIANRVHHKVWPVDRARNIARKLLS